MSPVKNTNTGLGPTRRSQAFSLSFVFRGSTRKRTSTIADLSEPPPACEEKIHYPVFNPHDPRHNPGLTPIWHCEPQTAPSVPPQTHGTQSLPRRSFHKARSSLLALGSGMLRRSNTQDSAIEENPGPVAPVGLVDLGHGQHGRHGRHGHLSSGFSTATTQEDLNFGAPLYRTGTPWPSLNEVDDETLANPLTNSITAPGVLESHRDAFPGLPYAERHVPGSVLVHPVSLPFDGPYMHGFGHNGHNGTRNIQLSNKMELDAEAEPSNSTEPNVVTNNRLAHYPMSTDWGVIESPEEVASTTSPVGRCSRQLGGPQFVIPEHNQVRNLSEVPFISLPSNDERMEPREDNVRADSDSLSSTFSSNISHHRASPMTKLKPLITRSGLDDRHSLSFHTTASSVPVSRNCSAEVRFAFPGLYHELLDQWIRQSHNNCANDGMGAIPSPSQTEGVTVSAQEVIEKPGTPSDNLLPTREMLVLGEGIEKSNSAQTEDQNPGLDLEPLRSFNQSTAASGPSTISQDADVHAAETSSSGMSDEQLVICTPPTTTESSGKIRHSFGLHMSLNDKIEVGTRQTGPSEKMLEHQIPDEVRNYSLVREGDMVRSAGDETESSSHFTWDDTTSAEVTSRTSMSIGPWSPVDGEIRFSGSFRDEYYLVDGKTSGNHPDRGDQPVKAGQRIICDGSIHGGPGLDRTPSSRIREVTELMSPMVSLRDILQSSNETNFEREREESESNDEYIPTYRAQPRHLH